MMCSLLAVRVQVEAGIEVSFGASHDVPAMTLHC